MIHPTPESSDKTEAEIPEDSVDTMWNDIIEAMEWRNCKICDDSDSSCGEEHEMDYKINICLITLKKILDINYIFGSLKQQMVKNILWE